MATNMTETKIKFELEKENKNSVRYKETPKDGMPPILGSIYPLPFKMQVSECLRDFNSRHCDEIMVIPL